MKFTLLVFRSIVAHTFTYFVFGLVLSSLFHYNQLFQMDIIKDFMRGYESPLITLGPLFQPLRGLIFAIAIWPIRSIIFEKKYGWLVLWNLIVMLGIISTPAAAPASIEGVIYSKLPLWYHLIGYPELLMQTLSYSFLIVNWEKHKFNQIFIITIIVLTLLFLFSIALSFFIR
ncbi:MAG: hypothetical protein JXQ65_04995 [Candidatus Marinimicrobia bacterium]|nr:hypothetical protein [Candidatus Neomarinimicrobiota bacterium]